MRYIEIMLLILMVMLSLSTVTHLNIIPRGTPNEHRGINVFDMQESNLGIANEPQLSGLSCIDTKSSVKLDPNINCAIGNNSETLLCRIDAYTDKERGKDWFVKSQTILEPGIIGAVLDFIDIFSTGITHTNGLINCYLPDKDELGNPNKVKQNIKFFTMPLIFMYLIALIQIVSGRNLEGTK